MRIVEKYGGTSVATPERIAAAAERAVAEKKAGAEVILVVSAQGDTTDEMIEKAGKISPAPAAREMDAYLSAGEQMSAALMAMAIARRGGEAVSLTGWQAGICTDSCFGNARILAVNPDRIEQELSSGRIVVVAGFQGVNGENITTLGRGGSDTTAVALAAALHADCCRIYTDVDGVYDRDPRKYPDARRYDRISCDAMLTLARRGAQVLHDRCVELAKEKNVTLEVCSAFRNTPGTIVADAP